MNTLHNLTIEQVQNIKPYYNAGRYYIALPIGVGPLNNSCFHFGNASEALEFIESLVLDIETRAANRAANDLMLVIEESK
jgi:hypothetical protein